VIPVQGKYVVTIQSNTPEHPVEWRVKVQAWSDEGAPLVVGAVGLIDPGHYAEDVTWWEITETSDVIFELPNAEERRALAERAEREADEDEEDEGPRRVGPPRRRRLPASPNSAYL
jgi:hypothetical protein